MSKSIIICGTGGQGTVLAAKVLSQSAVMSGHKVLSAETIGMAQRGGSVVSHVRIGEDVFSPLVPEGEADVMIAFDASEAVRNISYLSARSVAIVSRKVIQGVTSSLQGKSFSPETMIAALEEKAGKVVAVDTDSVCEKIGSAKVANMILLGAACKEGLFKLEDVELAMKKLVKADFYELNKKALEYLAVS
ncbi:MAG: indolepyruvate oxidoreductase subunit beta [Treponema sp.]|nr:indolepyruvate oxidoreductase subunit beta [Treponema sp.]